MATAQETIASFIPTMVTIGVAGTALNMLGRLAPKRKRRRKHKSQFGLRY